jgi:hypothetical protein
VAGQLLLHFDASSKTNVPLRPPPSAPHTAAVTRLLLLALLVLAFSAGVAQAGGDDHGGGGGDVRVAGTCGHGAAAWLGLRARDDGIELRFRLRQRRGRGVWRIAIVHERRVAARATRRTTHRNDSFELRRILADLEGSDTVVVHAWGSHGLACRVTATLRG